MGAGRERGAGDGGEVGGREGGGFGGFEEEGGAGEEGRDYGGEGVVEGVAVLSPLAGDLEKMKHRGPHVLPAHTGSEDSQGFPAYFIVFVHHQEVGGSSLRLEGLFAMLDRPLQLFDGDQNFP